nr:ribonuclease H-like domain-containing protein [Tanacetum cinerariifolium]
MLLIALPNEHLITFNQYKNAKTLFVAIQIRFDGNEATKKTQKTLLKKMYENFSAPSIESLDSIFTRLQKIVSQLAILGENISQEDLNLKFLRSLPSEWNTHVVVRKNKPDLDIISFDDLFNNFKIVAQEVKGTATSSSNSSSQNMAFVSSPSSTNEEYRQPRNQDSRNRNQDSSRMTVNVEKTASNAMVDIDGAGFDWSYMADDEVPTNMALMAFLDSEVHNDKTCSKAYLKSYETLKTQLDDLRIEFNKSEFNLATYKRGLASVEVQLVFYKKNKVIFCEQIVVLKRDISYKDSKISMLKRSQIPDNSRKGVGFVCYNTVPPPPTGLFLPLKLHMSNSGLEEFQQPEFESYGPETSNSVSEDISNMVKESTDAPLVKEFVSDDKLTAITIKEKGWYLGIIIQRPNSVVVNAVRANQINTIKASTCWVWRPTKLNSASITLKKHNYIDAREDQGNVESGCSRHMIGNMSYLSDFKKFDRGYVTFGGGAKGGKVIGNGTLKTGFTKVPRKNNMYSVDIKNIVPKESLTCLVAKDILDESMLWHRRLGTKDETYGILKSFITEIENIVDKKAEAVNTACYVQNRVLVVKPHNKTPYELFRGRTPALSFMRPFGCHVTILNTLDHLEKFDRKSDDGFFVRYSLTNKAFRVCNIRTRKVKENLHIRFLESKPIIAGINSNDFVDGSLFDSSSKNANNDKPETSSDCGKKNDDGVTKESGINDQERPKNSTQYVNTARPSINTVSNNVTPLFVKKTLCHNHGVSSKHSQEGIKS